MRHALIATAFLAASPAMAQSADGGEWTGEVQFSLAPKVGTALPLPTEIDPVDNSEITGSFTIRREDKNGFAYLALTLGTTSSPQLLDDNDETSSLFVRATVGDDFIPFAKIFRMVGGREVNIEPDAWRPYASYQYARVHSGFLDRRTSYDHTVIAGIRYRDVRSVMLPSEKRGIYAEFRGEVQRVWSSLDEREEIVPSARARLYSQPFAGGMRVFGEARGDLKFFTDRPLANGDDRQDQRLRLTAGADLSGLLNGPEIEIGVQYQKVWSNDVAAEHDRLYFTPSLTLRHTLGG